jgi:hypothetical protein
MIMHSLTPISTNDDATREQNASIRSGSMHRYNPDRIQSSAVSERSFEFDAEALNSRAYRQALSRR